MIPTIWHYEKGKTMETVKDQCVRGLGELAMNRQSTEDFQVSETTLYDTIMTDTYPYTQNANQA